MTSLLGLPADRAPRVVLDTAVVVSALVFGGGAPSALLLDLQDKLARPQLGFSRAEQAAMLNEYLPYAGKVRVPEAEQALSEGAPMALALARLAMAGKAHALVSGDGEMLSLHSRFCCPILTLDDFLAGLAEQRAKRRAMQAPSGTAAP
jgi:predicted nucleic acid-binding protein